MRLSIPANSRIIGLAILSLAVFLLSFSLAYADWGKNIVYSIVVGFAGNFAGLAGRLLDYSIEIFVIGAGAFFLDTGVGGVVDLLWSTVRDFFNLTFIFGLVYIGFKMILGSNDSGSRKGLVNLILAALLVNFSLFITKFIFDLTNLLATQISNTFVNNLGNVRVSSSFMDILGVQTLFNQGSTNEGETIITSWGQVFGGLIIFIVMIFVFSAGAFMLMVRFAAMILFMVLSPLMFIGWVFPSLQKITSDYWRGFLGRAFVAPVYLLLIYFSIMVLKSFHDAGGPFSAEPSFNDVFGASGSSVENSMIATIIPFILTAIFLVASVVVSQKLGADGAAGAVNIMNSSKNWAQKKATNAARATAVGTAKVVTAPVRDGLRRTSVGAGNVLERGLNRFHSSDSRLMRGAAGLVDIPARNLAKKAQGVKVGFSETHAERKARVSTNKTKGDRDRELREEMKADNNRRYVDDESSTVRDQTYTERMEHQRKIGAQMEKMSVEEIARMGFGNLKSRGVVANLKDETLDKLLGDGHLTKAQVDKLRQGRDKAQLEPALKVLNENITEVEDKGANATTEEQAAYAKYKAELEALNKEKVVARKYLSEITPGLSTESLGRIMGNADTTTMLSDPHLAQYITQAQTDQLEKSGIGTKGIKGAKENALFKEAEDALDGTSTSAQKLEETFDKLGRTVKGLSGEKLTGMSTERLTDERIAMHLSDKQIEDLQSSGKSVDDIQKIKTARDNGRTKVAKRDYTGLTKSTNATNRAFTENMRRKQLTGPVEQVARLPLSVFTDKDNYDLITPAVLEARLKLVGPEGAREIKLALYESLGINNPLSRPSAEGTRLANSPWTKWEGTTMGASFFG